MKRKITLPNWRYIISSCKKTKTKRTNKQKNFISLQDCQKDYKKKIQVKEFTFASKKSKQNKKKEEKDTKNQCRK